VRLAPPSQLRGAVLGCQAVVALCVAALALNGIDSLAVGCITAAGAAAVSDCFTCGECSSACPVSGERGAFDLVREFFAPARASEHK